MRLEPKVARGKGKKKKSRKRWGRTVDVTIRVCWLPHAEAGIVEAAGEVGTLLYRNSMKEAIALLVAGELDMEELAEVGLKVERIDTGKPKRVRMSEGEFGQIADYMKLSRRSLRVIGPEA